MVKKEKKAYEAPKKAAGDIERIDKTEVLSKVKKMAKKYGKVSTIEVKQRDPYVPRAMEKKLREDIKKMKAITANELAAKFDIRVSAIKKLLLTLEDEGIIK